MYGCNKQINQTNNIRNKTNIFNKIFLPMSKVTYLL